MKEFKYGILAACLLSCGGVGETRWPDPFLDSFRGTGIKYLFCTSGDIFTDTLFFDREGTLVWRKEFLKFERFAFDGAGFPKRHLILDGVDYHWQMTYEKKSSQIIQSWSYIYSKGWDFEDSQVGPTEWSVFLRLDGDGMITERDDTARSWKCRYEYDGQRRLVKSSCGHYGGDGRYGEAVYHYGESGLVKIEWYHEGDMKQAYYYGDTGFLDSAFVFGDTVVRYGYELYDD